MKRKIHILLCALLFVIGAFVGFYASYKMCHTIDTITDTVYTETVTTRTDTVRDIYPHIQTRKVVDTLWLDSKDSTFSVVIEQTEYSDSNYRAWVSGYLARMDSIEIYNKTTYIDRKETIIQYKTVQDTSPHFFAGAGLARFDTDYIPSLSVGITNRNFLWGVGVGLYKNKPLYGFSVNYKIK